MITCLVKPSTEENVCPKPSSHKGHAYETFVVLFVEICVELVAAATAADFVLSSSLLLASAIAFAAASRSSLCAAHVATCSRYSLSLNAILHGHASTTNAHNFFSHCSSTLNFLDDNAENFSRHTGHGAIVFIGNFDTHCFKHASQKECTRHPA